MAFNVFDKFGLSALIGFVKQAKKTSEAAASDAAGLLGEVQGLAAQTAEVFGQVDNALDTLDSEKIDKRNEVSAVVSVSGWQNDAGSAAYPKFYDLNVQGITAKDRADIMIEPNSVETAVLCGICPTSETLSGKIRIRAAKVPEREMTVRYWVEIGKE